MAVNAHEKLQVGHYFLLRQDYARAWRWYAEAERDLPPARPRVISDLWSVQQALQPPDDALFFRFYCLSKLGRTKEARARLEEFQGSFLPEVAIPPEADLRLRELSLRQSLQTLLDPEGLPASLLRDLYVAEVFLSLDAAEDGEEFFRQALADREAPKGVRLSKAVVLAQLLLVQDKGSSYAELTADVIAPALLELHKPGVNPLDRARSEEPRTPQAWQDSFQELALTLGGGSAVFPLCVPEFLAGLPDEQVRRLMARWRELQTKATDDVSRRVLDLALWATYERLGMQKEKEETRKRLAEGKDGFDEQGWRQNLADGVRNLREQVRRFRQGE
jgi:hypothetical protein